LLWPIVFLKLFLTIYKCSIVIVLLMNSKFPPSIRKQNIENLEAVIEGEQERFQLLADEDILLALYQKSHNKVKYTRGTKGRV